VFRGAARGKGARDGEEDNFLSSEFYLLRDQQILINAALIGIEIATRKLKL
jgi:hypothetical protein